eukprot:2890329-Rhodomonas_salina.1
MGLQRWYRVASHTEIQPNKAPTCSNPLTSYHSPTEGGYVCFWVVKVVKLATLHRWGFRLNSRLPLQSPKPKGRAPPPQASSRCPPQVRRILPCLWVLAVCRLPRRLTLFLVADASEESRRSYQEVPRQEGAGREEDRGDQEVARQEGAGCQEARCGQEVARQEGQSLLHSLPFCARARARGQWVAEDLSSWHEYSRWSLPQPAAAKKPAAKKAPAVKKAPAKKAPAPKKPAAAKKSPAKKVGLPCFPAAVA